MRRTAQWIIGLLISAAALWLAFRGVRLADLSAALITARYEYGLLALAFVWLGQWLRAHSWRVILGQELQHRQVFSALNAGYLLNNLLPLRLGELGRAYLISRTGRLTVPQALSSVLVERVIDLCMVSSILLAILPTIAFQGWAYNAALVAVGIVIAALVGLYTLLRQRGRVLGLVRWIVRRLLRVWAGAQRLEAMADGFIEGMQALQQPDRFFQAAMFSGLAWLSAGVSVCLVLSAFLPDLQPGQLARMGFFTLAVTALGIAAPSAPGSLGLWQIAVISALGVFGVPQATALSIALMHHLANYSVTSVLGALALAREGETLSHLAQSARELMSKPATKRV